MNRKSSIEDDTYNGGTVAPSLSAAPAHPGFLAFQRQLRACYAFRHHQAEHLCEVTSTNDILKVDWTLPTVPPRWLVADHQTAGHGRRERRWLDVPGESLLTSFTWHCAADSLWGRVPASLLAGLALFDSLHALGVRPGDVCWKWPNDIWLPCGKVAGVLVEACRCADGNINLVVGVGVNVGRPPEITVAASADTIGKTGYVATLQQLLPGLDRFALAVALAETWQHRALAQLHEMQLSAEFGARAGSPSFRWWLETERYRTGPVRQHSLTETGNLRVLTDAGQLLEAPPGAVLTPFVTTATATATATAN